MSQNVDIDYKTTRSRLIEAAAGLAAEGGLGAVGLREAARRTGVTHGAPYRHFADRGALIVAVAEYGFRELLDACAAAEAAAGSGPLRRWQSLGFAYMAFALRRPGLFRVMFSADAAAESVRSAEAAVFALCVRSIAAAQREGQVVDGDPQEHALLCWSTMHGLATLHIDGLVDWLGLDIAPEELARRLTNRVYRGLARR